VIACKGGEASAVRDNRNSPPLSSRAGASEELSGVEEFDNAVHAHKTNSAEQGIVDEVGREAPQAQARRRQLMPARLQHDHRLGASGTPCSRDKDPWAFDPVKVEQDSPGAPILSQIVQQIR
jgi:hypothetical protein